LSDFRKSKTKEGSVANEKRPAFNKNSNNNPRLDRYRGGGGGNPQKIGEQTKGRVGFVKRGHGTQKKLTRKRKNNLKQERFNGGGEKPLTIRTGKRKESSKGSKGASNDE